MRKITSQSVDAFVNEYRFKQGNTAVCGATEAREWYLMLHNNLIAKKIVFVNELWITDAGWQTVTTRERLNGVISRITLGWVLFQKNWEWYLTDGDVTVKWKGSATFRDGNLIKS
jgi:hypothetical protein